MKKNLSASVVWFFAWGLVTLSVKSASPSTGGEFYGIALPSIFALVSFVISTRSVGKECMEWVFTGLGAAAGGAFVLLALPKLLTAIGF